MSAIGPGTPVIAVTSENPYPKNTRYALTVGALYFVERVYHGQPWQNNRGVCSRDNCGTAHVVVHGRPWGYCPNFFRPFGEIDESLLRKSDAPVKEMA